MMAEHLSGEQRGKDMSIVAFLSMTGSVMIWAGISVDYKTNLQIIEDSLTG